MKKAHAKELADHVQESNKKYNELLKQKMDDEDRMEKEFEKLKAQLIKEWQERVKKAIEDTRVEE